MRFSIIILWMVSISFQSIFSYSTGVKKEEFINAIFERGLWSALIGRYNCRLIEDEGESRIESAGLDPNNPNQSPPPDCKLHTIIEKILTLPNDTISLIFQNLLENSINKFDIDGCKTFDADGNKTYTENDFDKTEDFHLIELLCSLIETQRAEKKDNRPYPVDTTELP